MSENQELIQYTATGTCCKVINVVMDGDTIQSVEFIGGCNGNQKGIASLVKGAKADEVIERLKGINCGNKGTSCPDQLAQCLIAYKNSKKAAV